LWDVFFFFRFLCVVVVVPVDSGKQLDRAERQKAGKVAETMGAASLTTGRRFFDRCRNMIYQPTTVTREAQKEER
jgi:hypothetical protein